MRTSPDDTRPSFVELVKDEFSFLTDRGFADSVEGEREVRYENDEGVFVRVFRDPRDKYVGYRVGLSARPKDALTAAELVRLSGARQHRGEYPERDSELGASIARVSAELRQFGERALSGDVSIYDEAMELRREHTSRYTKRMG